MNALLAPPTNLTTIAGNGVGGYGGDGGLASNAALNAPFRSCVNVQGEIFIADA